MGTKQIHQIMLGQPGLKFRVLVLGRANAGKTSILQRVCETTESPNIYREGKEVRHSAQTSIRKSDLTADQVTLEPSMEVGDH
jgi:septin family protein